MPAYIIILTVCAVLISTIFTVLSFKKTLLNLYLKTLSSTIFCALGVFSLFALIRKNGIQLSDNALIGGFLIIFALILCLVGDIILGMPRITELKRDTLPVIFGGASWFFIGHIIYCVALIVLLGINLYSLLFIIPMSLFFTFVNRKIGKLNYHGLTVGVYFYSIMESLAFAICSCALIAKFSFLSLILTVAFFLFFFSDTVLMHNYFGKKKRIISILCHATYYPAQILISLSVLFIA